MAISNTDFIDSILGGCDVRDFVGYGARLTSVLLLYYIHVNSDGR